MSNSSRDTVEAIIFKPAAGGGFVFQAPKPWLFGEARNYLVNEAQKAEILTVMAPNAPAWRAHRHHRGVHPRPRALGARYRDAHVGGPRPRRAHRRRSRGDDHPGRGPHPAGTVPYLRLVRAGVAREARATHRPAAAERGANHRGRPTPRHDPIHIVPRDADDRRAGRPRRPHVGLRARHADGAAHTVLRIDRADCRKLGAPARAHRDILRHGVAQGRTGAVEGLALNSLGGLISLNTSQKLDSITDESNGNRHCKARTRSRAQQRDTRLELVVLTTLTLA